MVQFVAYLIHFCSVHVVLFLTQALVFLQSSAMAENSSVAVAPTAAPTMLEELLEITAQSLVRTEVAEHYEVIRELGRGKYGHVMLVTHRQRGKELAAPCELLCSVSSPLAHMHGLMGSWVFGARSVRRFPREPTGQGPSRQAPSHCTQPVGR